MKTAGPTRSACSPNPPIENLVLKRIKPRVSPLILRKRAEAALGATRTDIAQMSAEEIKKLVHELQIHQIELQLQNEELRQSQVELAESRDRFNDLYDFAPVGYVTLDFNAKVLQANLTAASMLGVTRTELIGRRFTGFVTRDAQDSFYQHQRAAMESGRRQIGEIVLRRLDGIMLSVQVETICTQDPSTFTRQLRSTISDITALKRAEEALRQSHADLEKRVEARTRQENAVAALSREALASRDIGWLLRQAVVMLAKLLEVQFSKVLELSPAGDELVLRAGVGWKEGCLGVSRVPAFGDSQASYTLKKNEPILAEDITKEKRFRAASLLLDHSVVSGMSVVIRGRDLPYGVLSVHTASKRCFSDDEATFLQSIADVLAEAIMRRQLEERLIAISNREQIRLGYDLHDGLCQQLAGIEFRAVALAGKLVSNPDAQDEAQRIGALLRDSMQHARVLSRGLTPVDLEANGLMFALGQLATSCRQLYGVDCQFRYDRPILIEVERATHLYRIAQEAISNGIKHGHAKTIAIGLQHAGSEALLTITNDGLPLPRDPERRRGMGLQIMRYRADMIGATLRIESIEDGKTAVVCSFKPGE